MISTPALADFTDFVDFMNHMRLIERAIYMRGTDRRENDAEHCFQLALAAWYLHTKHKLSLNLERCLTYALVHDLVEVYAGDVPSFDDAGRIGKQEREEAALEEISTRFSDNPKLAEMIERYEKKEDAESTFIASLDKLLPIFNVILDGGHEWRVSKITYDKFLDMKRGKVDADPLVAEYYHAIRKEVDARKHWFHQPEMS